MDRSVRLTYRYHDVDLVELTASAWNEEFGDSTRLYISHGQLAEAADLLAGFPESVEDSREVKFGEFGPQFGAGAIALALQFSCSDRAGHCQLLLKLEADPILQNPLLQRVEMLAAIEPAAVDLFVDQIRTLDSSLIVALRLHWSIKVSRWAGEAESGVPVLLPSNRKSHF